MKELNNGMLFSSGIITKEIVSRPSLPNLFMSAFCWLRWSVKLSLTQRCDFDVFSLDLGTENALICDNCSVVCRSVCQSVCQSHEPCSNG